MPPLCELLRGSPELQRAAVGALCDLSATSDRACEAAVPAIPQLVAVLSRGSELAARRAALTLSNIITFGPQCGASVVEAGGPAALIRLSARSSSAAARAAACAALNNLSKHAADAKSDLMAAGILPAFVSVLQQSDRLIASDSSRTVAHNALKHAAHGIHNLCLEGTQALKPSAAAAAAAAAAGAAAALVHVLHSCQDEGVRGSVALALGCMAGSRDPGACSSIAAAGGIEALGERVCSVRSSPKVLAEAMRALALLLHVEQARCDALAAMPGLFPRLAELLRHGAGADGRVQPFACELVRVVAACELARDGLLAAGVEQALQLLAGSPGLPAAPAASDALRRLTRPPVQPAGERQSSAAAAAGSSAAPAAVAVPAAAQPQPPRPPRVCAAPGCGATRGLRFCGGCATVRYCSEACSRAHWKAHRAECRRLQAEQAVAAAPNRMQTPP